MPNPLVTGGSAPNGATAPVNPVNGLYPSTLREKNNFPINIQVLSTNRFGEISPIYAFECVPDDDIALSMENRLDSYTLASPLLSQLRRHTAHVAVPKQAIYYNNWSKLFVNPKKGDDVVPANVRALFNVKSLYDQLYTVILGKTNIDSLSWCTLAFCLELISPSSLLYRLRLWQSGLKDYGSSVFDGISELILHGDQSFATTVSVTPNISGSLENPTYQYDLTKIGGLRSFFNDILFFTPAGIKFMAFTGGSPADTNGQALYDAILALLPKVKELAFAYDKPVNIEHAISYQLACVQFFSNSDVDYVYTSELYRQNMESLVSLCGYDISYYSWNGIRIFYDWCSSSVLNGVLSQIKAGGLTLSYCVSFFINLFCLQRSLRYGDMTNSCFLEPLAVGGSTADVSGSSFGELSVSAVDTTIALLRQRYLHLVNSAPSTIQSYSASVFGVVPDVLPPEPRFISHHVDNINDVVNVNTAESQGVQNANLMSRSNSREFVSHFNQETIIISCEWFDCMQAYPGNLSPFALKSDRFDYYIPQLQNIGMQAVPSVLISPDIADETIFGYLPNDYEYKQALSICNGAFSTDFLPSWAFVYRDNPSFISPFSIRHRPVEFDQFYKSQSGFGANYFHFIQSHVLHFNASRPMEFSPGVLMRS